MDQTSGSWQLVSQISETIHCALAYVFIWLAISSQPQPDQRDPGATPRHVTRQWPKAMTAMRVLSEMETLWRALRGASLARFGDGELRLALGGQSASQQPDPRLATELHRLLVKPSAALVCVPNLRAPTPKAWFWNKYRQNKFTGLFIKPEYGSTWITRPDDAPWIDNPAYWDLVPQLWRGKDVTLVVGDEKSITPALLHAAASVRVVKGPRQHAYAVIDELAEQVGKPAGPVVLCLGATATVLAERLAQQGCQALDLGHLGMFMKRRDRKMITVDDYASPEYRATLQAAHARKSWGASGHHHAMIVRSLLSEVGGATVLDYGCGRGTLKSELVKLNMQPDNVQEYDPGIVGKDNLPTSADVVVATDVLEHIERDRLKSVLDHIRTLARKGVFLIIALSAAKDTLPDGRNAHLIIQDANWWTAKLRETGYRIQDMELKKGLRVWCRVNQ